MRLNGGDDSVHINRNRFVSAFRDGGPASNEYGKAAHHPGVARFHLMTSSIVTVIETGCYARFVFDCESPVRTVLNVKCHYTIRAAADDLHPGF